MARFRVMPGFFPLLPKYSGKRHCSKPSLPDGALFITLTACIARTIVTAHQDVQITLLPSGLQDASPPTLGRQLKGSS